MNVQDTLREMFEPELLSELESKARHLSVKEGDTIMHIGQTVRAIPFVLTGIAKVSRIDDEGRELLLYYIHPFETCAMSFACCMQQHFSEIEATAEEDMELLSIPVNVMDEWLSKYPTWKSFVMKTIRGRFNELLRTIDLIAFQKLDDRLVSYLKEKSKATGSTLINLSHTQIAAEMATSREVVSRLLKKLEQDNKLLLYRHQIKLLKEL